MYLVERAMVWSGGAVFAAALALCARSYFVAFGRLYPFRGWQPLLIDSVLFTVFAAHHSLFARDAIKRAVARVVPAHLIRSLYVWTASVLLAMVCLAWQTIGGEVYDSGGAAAIAHAAVQLAGVWLIARSVAKIDALELAGIRAAAAGGLQVAGPYRLVRHPLYLGWMLVVFGAARMSGDRLVFAVLTSAYLVIAIRWEEQSLSRNFGDEYSRYKVVVPWRVLPFIY
jgi:methanethiol S-methyltransferase